MSIKWEDGIHGEERSMRQRLAVAEERVTFTRRGVTIARVAYALCFLGAAVNSVLGEGWLNNVGILASVVGGIFGMYSAGRFNAQLSGLRTEVAARRIDLTDVQARILRDS